MVSPLLPAGKRHSWIMPVNACEKHTFSPDVFAALLEAIRAQPAGHPYPGRSEIVRASSARLCRSWRGSTGTPRHSRSCFSRRSRSICRAGCSTWSGKGYLCSDERQTVASHSHLVEMVYIHSVEQASILYKIQMMS